MRYTHTMAIVGFGFALWAFGLPLTAQAKPKP